MSTTELTDPVPYVEPTPEPTEDAPETPEQKAKSRSEFERRQQAKQMEALRAELDGYKRRDEETRKATLSEVQRLTEERDTLRAERERDSAQRLREKVSREFKLPDQFASRLVGSDEESLRADAEELAKLLPKTRVGTVSDPIRESSPSGGRTYKESQLADRAFYKAHEADIMVASIEGRITRGE